MLQLNITNTPFSFFASCMATSLPEISCILRSALGILLPIGSGSPKVKASVASEARDIKLKNIFFIVPATISAILSLIFGWSSISFSFSKYAGSLNNSSFFNFSLGESVED